MRKGREKRRGRRGEEEERQEGGEEDEKQEGDVGRVSERGGRLQELIACKGSLLDVG